MPTNPCHLHWAQAKVYGDLLYRELDLLALAMTLVYFDIGQPQEAPPRLQHCSAADLQAFFEVLGERLTAWSEVDRAQQAGHDKTLTNLSFPNPNFRNG